MHMQIAIEFGSDALDGDAIKHAAQSAIGTVATAIGHDLPGGSIDIPVGGLTLPVNVKFRRALRGPGEPSMFDPPTFVPPVTPAAPPAGGNEG